MIALLRGTLHAKSPNRLILDVGGVGYDVQVPLSTFYGLGDPGTAVSLRIHTHVREEAIALFGFATELELVRPDDDSRGTLWPWALVAASWQRGSWSAALATEASTSAQYRYRFDVLAQLARSWWSP